MATAVLRPRDCLEGRFHRDDFGSRPSPSPKTVRRKHPRPAASSASPPSKRSPPTLAKPARSSPRRSGQKSPPLPETHRPRRPLVMEEVRILKRGEELPPPSAVERRPPAAAEAAAVREVDLGPRSSEILPKKAGLAAPVRAPVYAGPAFFAASPEPSELPIPALILRKSAADTDEATRSLRRILRTL